MIHQARLGVTFAILLFCPHLSRADITLPDLANVSVDLVIPAISEGAAGAGKRVIQTTVGWEGTKVHHALYLPTDWEAGKSLPVIVEYAGNGGYRGKFGDTCDGTVEGSRLGYGITSGQGCLWLCLPYVEKAEGTMRNATQWWGDVEETKRYCLATVKDVCLKYGGDPARVVLAGFSRGSIGCNYIGLHDDEIARLWCGFICHSHYDGVNVGWPYAHADRASALTRLKRLNGRPQFISQEMSTAATEEWLNNTGVAGDWTFVPLYYRNHSDAWVLRDIAERRMARVWFQRVVGKK
ncbi:hypothetical protein EI77_02367 [Prosthecobacter fusiformis]|uniref:Uncharacterized protein n=1 Tax=Prosthecobacter fusiformis TaxID=48464 RepID=A0A4R7S1Z6_9BACT|nr:hypothetical protein [Prosthecobacter fusiformis]TDU71245.1 hypothetical protein EI77_02367 [Prosthecobacter fusiformis]